jgi:hypothetical protein
MCGGTWHGWALGELGAQFTNDIPPIRIKCPCHLTKISQVALYINASLGHILLEGVSYRRG